MNYLHSAAVFLGLVVALYGTTEVYSKQKYDQLVQATRDEGRISK
jgi:hypothetical protein